MAKTRAEALAAVAARYPDTTPAPGSAPGSAAPGEPHGFACGSLCQALNTAHRIKP